jgi:hypothetical protein
MKILSELTGVPWSPPEPVRATEVEVIEIDETVENA